LVVHSSCFFRFAFRHSSPIFPRLSNLFAVLTAFCSYTRPVDLSPLESPLCMAATNASGCVSRPRVRNGFPWFCFGLTSSSPVFPSISPTLRLPSLRWSLFFFPFSSFSLPPMDGLSTQFSSGFSLFFVSFLVLFSSLYVPSSSPFSYSLIRESTAPALSLYRAFRGPCVVYEILSSRPSRLRGTNAFLTRFISNCVPPPHLSWDVVHGQYVSDSSLVFPRVVGGPSSASACSGFPMRKRAVSPLAGLPPSPHI